MFLIGVSLSMVTKSMRWKSHRYQRLDLIEMKVLYPLKFNIHVSGKKVRNITPPWALDQRNTIMRNLVIWIPSLWYCSWWNKWHNFPSSGDDAQAGRKLVLIVVDASVEITVTISDQSQVSTVFQVVILLEKHALTFSWPKKDNEIVLYKRIRPNMLWHMLLIKFYQ